MHDEKRSCQHTLQWRLANGLGNNPQETPKPKAGYLCSEQVEGLAPQAEEAPKPANSCARFHSHELEAPTARQKALQLALAGRAPLCRRSPFYRRKKHTLQLYKWSCGVAGEQARQVKMKSGRGPMVPHREEGAAQEK